SGLLVHSRTGGTCRCLPSWLICKDMTGKTIKQIADELGVSKTAVRKKMTDEVKTKFAETVSGVIYISVSGENLIKQAFSRDEPQTEVSGVCGNQFPPVSGQVFGEFTVVIEVLKQQLEVKDRQIEQQQQSIKELTAALENTTLSLTAAQALHAGTMHQQLESLPPINGEPVDEQQDSLLIEPERKQGFWKNLFRK
ncbi:MAG: hypothetical protein ACRC9L_04255, partial [Brevinema sp.]